MEKIACRFIQQKINVDKLFTKENRIFKPVPGLEKDLCI